MLEASFTHHFNLAWVSIVCIKAVKKMAGKSTFLNILRLFKKKGLKKMTYLRLWINTLLFTRYFIVLGKQNKKDNERFTVSMDKLKIRCFVWIKRGRYCSHNNHQFHHWVALSSSLLFSIRVKMHVFSMAIISLIVVKELA